MGQRHSRSNANAGTSGPRQIPASTGSSSLEDVNVRAKEAKDAAPALGFRTGTTSSQEVSTGVVSTSMPVEEAEELWVRLFGHFAEEEDIERWLCSRFAFIGGNQQDEEGMDSLPCPWGLRQELGGPCGVLAAVQAFMVRELLWGASWSAAGSCTLSRSMSALSTAVGTDVDSDASTTEPSSLPASPSTSPRRGEGEGQPLNLEDLLMKRFASISSTELLVCALARILRTASPQSKYVWANVSGRRDITCTSFTSLSAMATWLLEEQILEVSIGPVMSFVCSVVLSRGLAQIEEDMDDASLPLVGKFGHCSQELTNLCLTGRASTNVFDGDLAFGEGEDTLTLKGVREAPEVGFLSALEPLRLCEVGKFLKRPAYPLWVVGGSSHYTLMFSQYCCQCRAEKTPSCESSSCEVCRTSHSSKDFSAPSSTRRFLHYNGADFGRRRPALLPVDINFASCSNAVAYEAKALQHGDQDSKLLAEIARSCWPGCEVSYQGHGDPPSSKGWPRVD